jgi:hypothetical protein
MEGWVSSRFSRDVPPIQIVFLIYDMGKRYSLRGNDCLVFRARFVDNHFAPDLDPALHTGIVAKVAVLRDLLNASTNDLYKLTHRQSNSSQ